MSWDIVILNLKEKIDNIDDVNDDVLEDIGTGADFRQILTQHFPLISCEFKSCSL